MKLKAALAGAAVIAVALAAHTAFAKGPSKILNVSYDVSRELFAKLNPVFAEQWKARTGAPITVEQSHGGSSSQARAVLEGLQADVVTFNQVTDVQVLRDKGKLVAVDWQTKFADNSSPFYSFPAFVVRGGNPKKIRDWDDLVRPGVKVVFPNPKTSGNGRYTYLAATAYALKKFGGDQARATDFVKALFGNVPVFDTGGRGATVTFSQRAIGDVLVTFEAEAYATKASAKEGRYDVVIPSTSFLAEFPVAVVDKVADQRGSREAATAYLNFLYTPEAQDIIAQNFYRVRDPNVVAKYASQFKPVSLATINDFGGWDNAQKVHFADGGLLDKAFVKR
jgi:sulfate transport system substrate-binding protein